MQCVVLTLFPESIAPYFNSSILKRACEKSLLSVCFYALRDFGVGKHRITDDAPYGGGAGMVLKPEPIFSAIEAIRADWGDLRVILPSPQGRLFHEEMAIDFANDSRTLVFICGHYEGIDARVEQTIPVEEVSIGNYILTGGELPSLVMIDAAIRRVPGVLGDEASLAEESFSSGSLKYPQYTRPEEFRGVKVPDVLLSGNHAAIREWRQSASARNTRQKRPDLVGAGLEPAPTLQK